MNQTLKIITTESKDLPKIEKFDVVPDNGEMFDTEFNVIMEDYLPKENMKYDLYGITQDENVLKLSDNTVNDLVNGDRTEVALTLPELNKIKVVLTTKEGEIVEIFKDVSVTKNADLSWTDITEQQRLNSNNNKLKNSKLWQSYQSIGVQANLAAQKS